MIFNGLADFNVLNNFKVIRSFCKIYFIILIIKAKFSYKILIFLFSIAIIRLIFFAKKQDFN